MARTKQTARGTAGGKAPRKTIATKAQLFKGGKKTASGGKKTLSKKKSITPGIKKGHRFRPGTVAVRDMKRYQKSTELLLRRAPFQRLIREITGNYSVGTRFAASALLALQEATESYMVKMFDHTLALALHAKRVTVFQRDFNLVVKTFRPDLRLHRVPPAHEITFPKN